VRVIPVLGSVLTMLMLSYSYLPVVINGGVGKNGSTIAVSLILLSSTCKCCCEKIYEKSGCLIHIKCDLSLVHLMKTTAVINVISVNSILSCQTQTFMYLHYRGRLGNVVVRASD